MKGRSPRFTMWRVRWRRPHWNATTVHRTRFFVSGYYARRFAERLEADGALVELHRADEAVAFDRIRLR